MRLDLPSQRNQTLRVNVAAALDSSRCVSIGTDDNYLYFHSRKGVTKIGTGLNNTNPGFVIGQVREYRGNERSSICVIGDKIYYRSTNIAPASLIVLSTETLLEIGHVLRNGEGTYPTADNSHVCFGHSELEEEFGEDATATTATTATTENKESSDEKKRESPDYETIRAQARAIMEQIVAHEENDASDNEVMLLEDEYDALMNMLPPEMQDQIAMELESDGPIAVGGEEARAVPAMGASTTTQTATQTEKSEDKSEKKGKAIPSFSPIFTDGRFLFAIEAKKPEETQVAESSLPSTSAPVSTPATTSALTSTTTTAAIQSLLTATTGTSLFASVTPLISTSSQQFIPQTSQPMAQDLMVRLGYLTSHLETKEDDSKNKDKDKNQAEEEKVAKVHLTIHAFDPEEKLEHCHSVTLKRPPSKNYDCVLDFSPSGLFDYK
ncbi:hypothetical protein RFI_29731 [Reticulomyxa filosa]|uniref:Uncharacterized protein n=1 Tax=Reticulomyxa filosa TaxID=46433 RepID=X6M3Q8_RETFI|nr:hypothetical protein RFI_29731 [Reticulomyxa filosa]|eukprot:ETO07660.1 hypothetical protein RFI_29731 [Reticulomyxa filosa]